MHTNLYQYVTTAPEPVHFYVATRNELVEKIFFRYDDFMEHHDEYDFVSVFNSRGELMSTFGIIPALDDEDSFIISNDPDIIDMVFEIREM